MMLFLGLLAAFGGWSASQPQQQAQRIHPPQISISLGADGVAWVDPAIDSGKAWASSLSSEVNPTALAPSSLFSAVGVARLASLDSARPNRPQTVGDFLATPITSLSNSAANALNVTVGYETAGGPASRPISFVTLAEAPKLTLVKTVVNDDGGDLSSSDFTLRIDGNPVASGVAYELSVGVHTITEDGPLPGYAASVWGGDCAANGSITLALGDVKTCTITNDDIAPTLTVIKKVINDNGGTAVAASWAMNVIGLNVSDTGFPGAPAPGLTINLHPGTYSIDDSGGPPGYSTTFSGNCAGAIGLGESRTCIITSDDISPALTVTKQVVNDHGGAAVASDWTMDISGANVSSTGFAGSEAGVTVNLDAGAYSVSESGGVSGYAISFSAACAGVIGLGDLMTCTITNDDIAPRLTVTKLVVNDNGGDALAGDWTMNVTGTNVSSTGFTGADDPGVTITLGPGTYSVGESGGPSGYATSLSAGCSGVIGLGGLLTCTITSGDIAPKLTVIATVVNDNGGDAVAGDWNIDISGTNVSSARFAGAEGPGTTIDLDLGAYNVGASGGPTGYAMSFSAGCTGVIALGGNLTCTITNDDIAPNVPTLTVINTVVNDAGGSAVASDWNIDIAGVNVSGSGFAGAAAGVTITLDPGVYSVSESGGPSGYAMSFSTGCSGIISAGDVLTCTVTNTYVATGIPTLTVIKKVVNDDGGPAVASDWTIDIVGANVSNTGFPGAESGVTVTLDTGTYSVSGSGGLPGYAMSFSADCSGVIGIGDALTCTVTSGDIAPQLTVVKAVINGGGGSAAASDWTMNIAGINVSKTGFPGAENPGVTITLSIGTFDVRESGGPSGYAITRSPGCSGVISLGDVLTCTIITDDITSRLTVIHKLVNDGGGSAVASDWAMDITGQNVSNTGFLGTAGGVTITLDPGTFSVYESGGPSGYAITRSADCSGIIDLGEDLTCTITADDLDPRLIVITKVINDNGSAVADDWTMDIIGKNVSNSRFFGAATGITVTLDPGAYNVGERAGPPGYAMSFSPDCTGAIRLGDTLYCTITNDDIAANIPALTVIKRVVNDDGGAALASEWTIDITGANVSSTGFVGAEAGVTITLGVGAYSVSETGGPNGYAMILSDGCSGEMDIGDKLTCTITSDDEPGFIFQAANAPPTASITSPADGSSLPTDLSIDFIVSGADEEDVILAGDSLVWTSSIDGEIGTGQSFTRSLSVGIHTITVTATDSQGASARASVIVTIEQPAFPVAGGGGGGRAEPIQTPEPTPGPTATAEPTATPVKPTLQPASIVEPTAAPMLNQATATATPTPGPALRPQPTAIPEPTEAVSFGATPVPAAMPSLQSPPDGDGLSLGAMTGAGMGVIAVLAAVFFVTMWRRHRVSAARSNAIFGRVRTGRTPR